MWSVTYRRAVYPTPIVPKPSCSHLRDVVDTMGDSFVVIRRVAAF